MAIITYSQSKREYSEGIGSLFQRELLAYLVSIFLKINFNRSKFFFYTRHNKIYYSKKIYKLFNFFGRKLSNVSLTNVNNTKLINKKKIFAYNIPFKSSENFFRKLDDKNKKIIVSYLRKKFWKKNNFIIKKNIIVLHLRNYSKGDNVLFTRSNIERSFPYQIFSFNYNIPNQNFEFYRNWYVSLVKKIVLENKLKKNNLKIYLCSTGYKKEFQKIGEDLSKIGKFKLLLNFNEYKTLKLMICAEFFILAQSSFSYLASFLNVGKKYIRNSYRSPLPPDVILDKDYDLLKFSYFYYGYCMFLEVIYEIKIFLKYTDFIQIIKNKFHRLFNGYF